MRMYTSVISEKVQAEHDFLFNSASVPGVGEIMCYRDITTMSEQPKFREICETGNLRVIDRQN